MICCKIKASSNCKSTKGKAVLLFCLFVVPLLTNCSTATKNLTSAPALYSSPAPAGLQPIHSPSFIISSPQNSYNLIGSPAVRKKDHGVELYVDSTKPAIYFESQVFSTEKSSYTNLIYRIHFEKVPFSFFEPRLTTGKNPGILIIYTINSGGELLLITTVGTCGCYLAFFPTDNLPQEDYPDNWPEPDQDVYGYPLPSTLPLTSHHQADKIVFTLERGNHRISDAKLLDFHDDQKREEFSHLELTPMSALYHLPYKETTISFFEQEGKRKGYVKNNLKILERLLISWWAFDLRVGEDKGYGKDDNSGIPLYTSLKFWHRNASDLKNFAQFLSYWGWGL